jgi:hypothetical protein
MLEMSSDVRNIYGIKGNAARDTSIVQRTSLRRRARLKADTRLSDDRAYVISVPIKRPGYTRTEVRKSENRSIHQGLYLADSVELKGPKSNNRQAVVLILTQSHHF